MSSRPSTFALTAPGPLRLYSTLELLQLPPPEWLIDGIMPTGGLVGLYGQPGHGKSFIAIDMALSVATGLPWQGRSVKSGMVLYVSAEGGTGIGKRVRAWLQVKGIQFSAADVAWLTESIPINSGSEDMDVLLGRINDEVERQPCLVVIDTLARCFDGDENQQQDMGRFIQGIDRLRREFEATVIVVHHTRLDADRERGSTAFRGAADTMISCAKRKDTIVLLCNKQKDSEEFKALKLRLQVVPEIDSCVVELLELFRGSLGSNRVRTSLDILRANGPLTWDAWRQFQDLPKSTFHRLVMELKESGKIIKENGLFRVSTEN